MLKVCVMRVETVVGDDNRPFVAKPLLIIRDISLCIMVGTIIPNRSVTVHDTFNT